MVRGGVVEWGFSAVEVEVDESSGCIKISGEVSGESPVVNLLFDITHSMLG